jgi:hypothetical protein
MGDISCSPQDFTQLNMTKYGGGMPDTMEKNIF